MRLRCKGMVVVAQRAFIEGHRHATLLGKLAEQWGAEAGAGGRGAWVDAVDVMNASAKCHLSYDGLVGLGKPHKPHKPISPKKPVGLLS